MTARALSDVNGRHHVSEENRSSPGKRATDVRRPPGPAAGRPGCPCATRARHPGSPMSRPLGGVPEKPGSAGPSARSPGRSGPCRARLRCHHRTQDSSPRVRTLTWAAAAGCSFGEDERRQATATYPRKRRRARRDTPWIQSLRSLLGTASGHARGKRRRARPDTGARQPAVHQWVWTRQLSKASRAGPVAPARLRAARRRSRTAGSHCPQHPRTPARPAGAALRSSPPPGPRQPAHPRPRRDPGRPGHRCPTRLTALPHRPEQSRSRRRRQRRQLTARPATEPVGGSAERAPVGLRADAGGALEAVAEGGR